VFGEIDEDEALVLHVGQTIKSELEGSEFEVGWDGTTKTRIFISSFEWKRRKFA